MFIYKFISLIAVGATRTVVFFSLCFLTLFIIESGMDSLEGRAAQDEAIKFPPYFQSLTKSIEEFQLKQSDLLCFNAPAEHCNNIESLKEILNRHFL